ncbi:Peptide transport system permease protein sapC [Altererythrobacter epoxidivorans]|uniref:Peptide transport system permease protein sapC n=1 Tax=Altererythrobacter epoxidivorans TaxID=361183 RepID=A0A0M5KYL4_9SPHN|nr:SapC family protein [Altererythrobacter epoxidivorans]ALE16749.1 Peptide transport system permease protein sapC [Altererythrobacter epoxidivorans]
MASAPQPQLPVFYNDLMPLNSRDHKGWKSTQLNDATFFGTSHAVPITVEEFVDAQRSFPIVFTSGEGALPIALMGLNEGVNTFVGEDGKLTEDVYVPAYVRRYPYMLARLRPDSDDLSLCFDPSAGVVGEFDEGNELFDAEGKPTEFTNGVMEFCRNFEEAGVRTQNFMADLAKHDLLMDGEIAITRNDDPERPFVYRGFRMVDENKLRELPTEVLEELNKSGALMMIHAHLFSLNLMRVIFARQSAQGKIPQPNAAQPAG